MTKKRSTRLSLFTSLIALLVCCSMLIGTTFAWFTDTVQSESNLISTGNLDIELYHASIKTNGADERVNNTTKLFDSIDSGLWEPGAMVWERFTVKNEGSLALKYQFALLASEATVVDGVSFASLLKVAIVEDGFDYTREKVQAIPADRWKTVDSFENITSSAAFLPGAADSFGIVIWWQPSENDNLFNMNNGKIGEASVNLGVALSATQAMSEEDSFGSDYDEDAVWPEIDLGKSVTVPVGQLDASNKTIAPITMSGHGYNVTVPAGVEIADGAKELTLTVDATDRSSNINMTMGQISRSLDVHIEGISENNDVPMLIELGAVLPTDYKQENIELYHVENGVANKMNLVADPALHNDFSYNSATGEVTVALASFSEVTAVVAVGDPWAGGVDISWYNTTDTVFTLATEDQFAGFAAIVGGMVKDANGNEIWDTFEGKTVKLDADLDLGSKNGKIFTPVGYRFTDDNNKNGISNESKEDISSNVYSFEGIFDGDNHIISNILQRTWDIKGDDPHYSLPNELYYNDGMGIFGFIYNGTVKNLVVNNFQSDGEFSTTGCVAAYVSGNSTFDNIKVVNSNPRAYNVPNGGVVGYAYNQSGSTATVNFNNITVDSSNKISALWGSWDVGCGGILGRVNGETTVNMTNCEVGAVIDVFNDVCGNYQYYQYRYAGMLVGTVGGDTNPLTGGEKVNFSNVKVYIGNWADYYYCEFEKNSVGSYTEDYQCSRVEKNEINIDPATNLPYKENLSPCRHQHTENEKKENKNMGTYLPFDQLYTGYGWGSSPVKSADGVEVIKYFYTVTYMDGQGNNVLATEYVTSGERSETKLWANAYTVKSSALTTNEGKKFVGWVNTNSENVTSVPAGNYKDVILYESWENPYIIRFVDVDGKVIYSEAWTSSNQGLSGNPGNPPAIEGYIGAWEDGWQDKLKNVTSDVTIKPVYILEEYADEGDHVHLDENSTAAQLFSNLAAGKSVVMGGHITSASGKNELGITGGKTNLCVITGKTKNSRLNLNSFDLTCTFDHSANKSWHVFDVTDGATLTVSGGITGDGHMVITFQDVKSPVYLFSVSNGGTLVLEAGVQIEINYPSGKRGNIYSFNINGTKESFAKYDGIYVNDSVDGKITITVGVTTTITEAGVTQQR